MASAHGSMLMVGSKIYKEYRVVGMLFVTVTWFSVSEKKNTVKLA